METVGDIYLILGLFTLSWIFVQFAVFGCAAGYYSTSPAYSTAFQLLGAGLLLARGAAYVLMVDFAVMLLTMSLSFLTYVGDYTLLRRVMKINRHKQLHMLLGSSICVASLIHVIAHYFNEMRVSKALNEPVWQLLFVNPTGLSGHIALGLMIPMFVSAIPRIRRRFYELFLNLHLIYVPVYALMCLHGAFCFIKSSDGTCGHGPMFWKFNLVPIIVYVVDRIYRAYRTSVRAEIVKVIEHHSNTIEIRFLWKSLQGTHRWNFKPSQFVKIKIPEISNYEWHPFTLTSAPEDPYLSVHISCVGDWTKALQAHLRQASRNRKRVLIPHLYVDGPFTSPSDEAKNFEQIILIGSGIGVTPFASVLKSLRKETACKSGMRRKVHFIWVNRQRENFEWFYDLLSSLETSELAPSIEISLYWTIKKVTPSICREISYRAAQSNIDPVTKLRRAKTYFGRPNWDTIFDRFESQNKRASQVGVFFCGAEQIGKRLEEATMQRSNNLLKWVFHKEFF